MFGFGGNKRATGRGGGGAGRGGGCGGRGGQTIGGVTERQLSNEKATKGMADGKEIGKQQQVEMEADTIQWRKARKSTYFKEIGCDLWTRNLLGQLYDDEFDEAMQYGPPDMYILDPKLSAGTKFSEPGGITMALYNMRAISAQGQEQQNQDAGPSTSAAIVYKKREEQQPMMEKKKKGNDDDDDVHLALEAALKDDEDGGGDDEF